jgi:putative oxidoreductase
MAAGKLETDWTPHVLSLLRIVTALIFFAHGSAKLLGFPPTSNPMPAVMTLSWFAGLLEVIGAPLLFLGLFTRPVAFILSGEMAFAYWIGHAPQSIYPLVNRGDAAILYCFIFLYLAFAGPGPWSLDHLLSRSRREGVA